MFRWSFTVQCRVVHYSMTGEKKDLYNLADGWLELESDPGLFTLLMEDMGVQGVQVHDINSTHGGYGSTGTYY